MSKSYRTTKIVIPGWEKCNQRAYLVVDRESGEPLGRVHDSRLWNIYNPEGEHWTIAHSGEDLHGNRYETRRQAVQKLWRAHKVVEIGPEKMPSLNLEHAQNFDYNQFTQRQQ